MKYTQNVVSCGPVKVKELWRFDKQKCARLNPNGSNFFSLAERIR
jgi:hypothetical protein